MDVNKALRAGTARLHRTLEAQFGFLLDPALSRSRYRDHLRMLEGFYGRLEPSLMAAAEPHGLGGFLEMRRKVPFLEQDEAVLGHGHAPLPEPPPCPDAVLPPTRTLADVLGVSYVLEGATLGGRVVLRHLRRSVGVTPQCGGRFMFGYGRQTSERWRDFRALLDQRAGPPMPTAALVGAARDTFGGLASWKAIWDEHRERGAWSIQ